MARPRIAGAWWDRSWNPVGGCLAVSTGCRRCYAARLAGTQQSNVPLYAGTTEWVRGRPVFNGKVTVLPPDHSGWGWPLRWPGAKEPKLGAGLPSLIFVADTSDLFFEKRPLAHINRVISSIAWSKHNHIGQLLTKRPHVMADYFMAPRTNALLSWRQRFWLGFSAERQKEFDERWPYMWQLAERGWIVFVSIGPMLGPVKLPADFLAYGQRVWVIVSGEEDKDARPMDPDWARAVRDQCANNNVPFFLLQMGGREEVPPLDLFVREFPRWPP
jgi:protein gp37